jgi:MYXO-CTERM domain-containing protein
MILPLLGVALAADTGDTCPGIVVPGATYEDDHDGNARCVCPVIDQFCAGYPDGICPTWTEVSAATSGLKDCGPGSTLAHLAIASTSEWSTSLGFDATGTVVWAYQWIGMGDPWCCDGTASYSIEWGTAGTCLTIPGDTADDVDTSDEAPHNVETSEGCGCSARANGPFSFFAALLLALAVLGRRDARHPSAAGARRPPV